MTTRIWGRVTSDGAPMRPWLGAVYVNDNKVKSQWFETKFFAKRYVRKHVRKQVKEFNNDKEPYTYIVNIPSEGQSRWERWLRS